MNRMAADKFKLLTSMTIFGTIGIIRKNIPYPSSVVALVRGVIGVIFLLGVLLYKKEGISLKDVKKNGVLLCFSGIFLGANWILLFEAYRYTTVSVATMCYYMAPVIMILVSPFILHESLTKKKGICAAVAVVGMILVSGILETGISGMRGILLGLGAAVLYAGVVLLNKFIRDISANNRTIFQLGISAVAVFPYVMLTEDVTRLDTSLPVLGMLLVIGILHTGISYAMYFDSVRNIPAQTVALFSYIDPVVAVILSVVVLKEPMSMLAVVGVVLVIGATVVSELPKKKVKI